MSVTTSMTTDSLVRVAELRTLERDGVAVVTAGGRSIAIFHDDGEVYAVDNRCPHMGFPLHRGTVRDGILTCHWHHAKFDLAGGCTFDPFADDVQSFATMVRDGVVYVDPTPAEVDPERHWLKKIDEGLEHNIPLVLAKAVNGARSHSLKEEIVRKAALFGVRNRASGWNDGLSILTAMARVYESLEPSDRPRALFHGLLHVARATENQPRDFDLPPLDTTEARAERYLEWFRRFVDVRAEEASERTLRTAIKVGLPKSQVSDAVFGAATDHIFMDVGHSLDFCNKAFEVLDHIGWEEAAEVLPSLIPSLVGAQRMEESSAWRHPVDLPNLLAAQYEALDDAITGGSGKNRDWDGHGGLADQILDGEADDSLDAITSLIREGVPLTELSAAVAYAACRRLVHFRVTNEFGDWNTVHHTFTYANGVDQALRRSPSKLLARGIFDGAAAVYLDRFLNVPKQAIPRPTGTTPTRDELMATFDEQGRVDETAQIVTDLLAGQKPKEVIGMLGHALLREDAGFHAFQIFEAGIAQHRNFVGRPEATHIVIGVARFLSAHYPTVRSVGQTFEIAARLDRGESLSDE